MIVVTASQLNAIAAHSDKQDYNRLLREDFVANPASQWALSGFMVHRHRCFEEIAPHLRAFVYENGKQVAMLDIEENLAVCLGLDMSEVYAIEKEQIETHEAVRQILGLPSPYTGEEYFAALEVPEKGAAVRKYYDTRYKGPKSISAAKAKAKRKEQRMAV